MNEFSSVRPFSAPQQKFYFHRKRTFFSKEERRLTKAEILHNRFSISISEPLLTIKKKSTQLVCLYGCLLHLMHNVKKKNIIYSLYCTCALRGVKEQLGWSKTLARVSRLERVRSISLLNK